MQWLDLKIIISSKLLTNTKGPHPNDKYSLINYLSLIGWFTKGFFVFKFSLDIKRHWWPSIKNKIFYLGSLVKTNNANQCHHWSCLQLWWHQQGHPLVWLEWRPQGREQEARQREQWTSFWLLALKKLWMPNFMSSILLNIFMVKL